MNREEAANVLWWASKQHYPGDQMDITEYVIEAFDVAITALRGPQPDPITGLVPCGCGERAMILGLQGFCYECIACGTTTRNFETEAQAKAAWNTSMGYKGGAE